MDLLAKPIKIVDKGECLSTLNTLPQIKWNNEKLKNLSGKNEWQKHNFYPSNGLVGIVVDEMSNPVWGFKVYIVEISNKYYVPMTLKGISEISANEFRTMDPENKFQNMDSRQQIINSNYDKFING